MLFESPVYFPRHKTRSIQCEACLQSHSRYLRRTQNLQRCHLDWNVNFAPVKKLRETHGQKHTFYEVVIMKPSRRMVPWNPRHCWNSIGSMSSSQEYHSYQSSRNFVAKLLALGHSKFWSPGSKKLYTSPPSPAKSLIQKRSSMRCFCFFPVPSWMVADHTPLGKTVTSSTDSLDCCLEPCLELALEGTCLEPDLHSCKFRKLGGHRIQKRSEEKEFRNSRLIFSILNFSDLRSK